MSSPTPAFLARAFRLSPRESQIASHLAVTGDENPDIALRFGLSTYTVNGHVARVMLKIGVHTRSAVVGEAWRAWCEAHAIVAQDQREAA